VPSHFIAGSSEELIFQCPFPLEFAARRRLHRAAQVDAQTKHKE
jgi:hypothetical protein